MAIIYSDVNMPHQVFFVKPGDVLDLVRVPDTNTYHLRLLTDRGANHLLEGLSEDNAQAILHEAVIQLRHYDSIQLSDALDW